MEMNIDDFRRIKARDPVVLTHWVKTSDDSELYHYGTKEHSGRYDWGSGDRPYQRLEGKNGGVFRRKRKDTESIREINKRATAKIKGKTDEEYEKERTQESYDYFKNKRQEKNDTERPMAKIMKESAEKAKKIPKTEKLLEKEEPKEQPKSEENNRLAGTSTEQESKSDDKPTNYAAQKKSQPQQEQQQGRDERDLRTDRSSSEMSTKELKAYNERRQAAEQYEKYRRQDNPTGGDIAKEIVKGLKDVHGSVNTLMDEHYKEAHKKLKDAKVKSELQQLSDADLQKIVRRLQLEKQYKDLSPDVIIEGEAQARKIMSIIGTSLKVADFVVPSIETIARARRR